MATHGHEIHVSKGTIDALWSPSVSNFLVLANKSKCIVSAAKPTLEGE